MSTAKCQNYTGCLLAYRGEEIQLPAGAPLVCPECGKPVTPVAGGAARLIKWLIIIAIAGLLVIGAAVAVIVAKKKFAPGPGGDTGNPTPDARSTPKMFTPVIDKGGKTTAGGTPSTIPQEPIRVVPKPDTSLENEQNRRVKEDVLKRIDLMPNISAGNKDKLYNSVTRARGMGMVLQIPFGSGKTALSPAEINALKEALDDPSIMRLRDDPTAVFVVLGYADSKGDDSKNIAVSQARADSVVAAMRDRAGVANVTHAVAMGGSTLHDPQKLESNRVVEVWAVLP